MKATATTVLKLVQGSKVFLIPTFQRRYTWKKKQWSQLWNDLMSEAQVDHPEDPDSLHGHFLGSVVLHPALGPASTLMRHQVIDGQQRLTTILLLLAALRDVRQTAEPEWNPSAIDDQYLRNPFSDEYPERLVPTKLDREAYRKTVRQGVATGDMGIAYNYFRSEIERVQLEGKVTLAHLETTLLLHMLIVEITTKSGDSVNSIFNTLNSKGMDLSAADLVRNEILHHIGEVEAEVAHDEYWIPMEEALVNPRAKSPDREFVTFLWAREVALNPKTSRDELFPAFERRFRDHLAPLHGNRRHEGALSQLKEIYNDHLLFLIIRDPSRAVNDKRVSKPLYSALMALKEWRSEPATPAALWILKSAVSGAITQEDAATAINVLLSYLVKRILHGVPTNQLNRLLTPLASELEASRESGPVAEQMRATLSRQGYYWPSDSQVLASVASNPIYASAKRYVKFLLSSAERQLPGRETASLGRSTIEHVMPQQLSEGWMKQLEMAGVDLDDAEALTHTLGNLTLTENNSGMGNAVFEVKRDEYFKSSALRLNRGLAELDKFLPEQIQSRSVALAQLILAEFNAQPISSARTFDRHESGAAVEERLEALLQSLTVGFWVDEEALVSVLGATSEELRSIANRLDPTLARLIRTASAEIPEWFSARLRADIAAQDASQGPIGVAMPAEDLSEIVAQMNDSGEDADEYETLPDSETSSFG